MCFGLKYFWQNKCALSAQRPRCHVPYCPAVELGRIGRGVFHNNHHDNDDDDSDSCRPLHFQPRGPKRLRIHNATKHRLFLMAKCGLTEHTSHAKRTKPTKFNSCKHGTKDRRWTTESAKVSKVLTNKNFKMRHVLTCDGSVINETRFRNQMSNNLNPMNKVNLFTMLLTFRNLYQNHKSKSRQKYQRKRMTDKNLTQVNECHRAPVTQRKMILALNVVCPIQSFWTQ